MIPGMARFLIPTDNPESWKSLLAEPEKHWKKGRSAWMLAHSWEDADGFPPEVARVLGSSDAEVLRGLEFVAGFPEWQTPLPGGRRASQTDLLVQARNAAGQLVVIGIEGKVDEPFGPIVSDWYADATPGKKERLGFLVKRLGVEENDALGLRYQLLHRTVSATLEAEHFGATAAMMLVHSFDPGNAGHRDFERFKQACAAPPDEVARFPRVTGLPTFGCSASAR